MELLHHGLIGFPPRVAIHHLHQVGPAFRFAPPDGELQLFEGLSRIRFYRFPGPAVGTRSSGSNALYPPLHDLLVPSVDRGLVSGGADVSPEAIAVVGGPSYVGVKSVFADSNPKAAIAEPHTGDDLTTVSP